MLHLGLERKIKQFSVAVTEAWWGESESNLGKVMSCQSCPYSLWGPGAEAKGHVYWARIFRKEEKMSEVRLWDKGYFKI